MNSAPIPDVGGWFRTAADAVALPSTPRGGPAPAVSGGAPTTTTSPPPLTSSAGAPPWC